MSKIPRCNVSATKPQPKLQPKRPPIASTPLEPRYGKAAGAKNGLSFSSSAELSMIENERPLKRSATALHHPLKKQPKLARVEPEAPRIALRAAETRAEELERRLEDLVEERTAEAEKAATERRGLVAEVDRLRLEISAKTNERDSLESILKAEIGKRLELDSALEEHRTKLAVQLGEIAFLKMKQSAIEEKNREHQATVDGLRTENGRLEASLGSVDAERIQLSERSKTAEMERDALSLRLDVELKAQRALKAEMELLEAKLLDYVGELHDRKRNNEYLTRENDKNSTANRELAARNEELQKKIESMHDNEKVLRNRIQDLKGHIRVFCRIRPSLPYETSKPTVAVKILDSNSMELEKIVPNSNGNPSKKQNVHQFSFDGVFNPSAGQTEVFDEVSAMIQSALDGFNVCIFAYGQTGSGKTYTMEGDAPSENAGIVPRAITMIFEQVPILNKLGWEFAISASFLEIYNECIYDLLDSNRERDHSIKMSDSKGSDVYVSNLREEPVTDAKALMNLLLISQKNRMTAATLSNERSSRSHSIAKIKFSAIHRVKNEKFTSSLNFVDLAGSESGKNSQRMDETKSINKSLSELSKVILALQAKQSHVPYRNSKLTHLLMPSLGGNSKTLMLINVSPLDECYQETVNSLRFAATVNSCRNSVSKKNVSSL